MVGLYLNMRKTGRVMILSLFKHTVDVDLQLDIADGRRASVLLRAPPSSFGWGLGALAYKRHPDL